MKQVLVTGATGDVGRPLVEALIAAGHDVTACARNAVVGQAGRFEKLDIQDRERFSHLLKGKDILIHLAGYREPSGTLGQLVGPNIVGVCNAFEAALRAGVTRVIYASSINASQGDPSEQPMDDEVVSPENLYGATKVFGEAVARLYATQHGISAICLRMGWTLRRKEAPGKLKNLPMDPLFAKRIFLSAEDFSQLVLCCIDAPDSLHFGIYNALSDNREKRLSIAKAKKELGYAPVDDAFSLINP